MKATREVPGATCNKISNILPMTENSKEENPVMFPPGRARLFTQPVPTGSPPLGNTIGTELVFIISTGITRPPRAKRTSGFNSKRLAALARMRSISSPVQRSSNWILPPSVQPSFCNSCRNARRWAWISVSLAAYGIKIPMRRIRKGGCARAASGHVTAAPPSSAMNSRRLIRSPRWRKLAGSEEASGPASSQS